MKHIKRLSDITVNQIAAGEVVTNPANVIKELIENSLDAGSSKIEIAIREAGHELIMVSDDGQGITKADLPLALMRHATSKLEDEDLISIKQLGFRGEALAAITAVSKVEVISRVKEQAEAWKIEGSGTELSDISPAAGRVGTCVKVRDLFYNVPARRKFLRNKKTESLRLKQLIKLMSLTCPQVAFRLIENDKVVLELPANQVETRLGVVMTKDFLNNAVPLQYETSGMKVTGFISIPTYNRPEPRYQYIYINNRLIRDRLISRAVKNNYHDVQPQDKHPVCCIFLQIDPHLLDVNVHPGKEEVRFSNPQQIYITVANAIRNSLFHSELKTSSEISKKAESYMTINEKPLPISSSYEIAEYSLQQVKKPFQPVRDADSRQFRPTITRFEPSQAPETRPFQEADLSLGAALGQVFNSYIVAQSGGRLIIVDQHAAHERIVYENLKQQLATGKIASQMLLIPATVDFDNEEDLQLLVTAESDLAELGLVVEQFGTSCLLIRQVPALASRVSDWQALLKAVASEIRDSGTGKDKNKLERYLAEIACHTSIKAGEKLNLAEMQKLLDTLAATPNNSQCNHGRPTYVDISTGQLEKLFQRR